MEDPKEYKGMRSFTPIAYERIAMVTRAWVKTARMYGFRQCKTPLLDPVALYESKTSEEILAEQSYTFNDRDDRKVILRPEMTPGIVRMVIGLQKNNELSKPYKLFTIGSVFRYERKQKHRTREHIQFNADIFGVDDLWADVEILSLAVQTLKRAGIPTTGIDIRINDRKALEKTIRNCGVKKEIIPQFVRLLDKREKVDDFEAEVEKLDSTIDLKTIDCALEKQPESVKTLINQLPQEFPATYSPSLVRGFDYYTGLIFEIYAKEKSVKRSLVGGGRYDALVERLGGKPMAAVGFGMGDVTLAALLEEQQEKNQRDAFSSSVTFFVTTEDGMTEGYRCAEKLRRDDVSVNFVGYTPPKKITDWYQRVEKGGGTYVAHLNTETMILTIKNVKTKGEEQKIELTDKSITKIVNALKS